MKYKSFIFKGEKVFITIKKNYLLEYKGKLSKHATFNDCMLYLEKQHDRNVYDSMYKFRTTNLSNGS